MIKDRKERTFSCDACGCEFSGPARSLNLEFHFCKKSCMNKAQAKGGVLWERNKKRNIEKYGVEHTLSRPEVREKFKNTCIERYGVENPSQVDFINDKKSKSAIETFQKNGKEINAKRALTNIERIGVPWPMMSKEIRKKSVETFKEKYGKNVKCAMDIKEVKEKTDFESAAIKRHSTMKKRGSYKTSKPEEKVYEFLCKKYGKQNIERQAIVKNWPIDFYIKTIDVYVQVDGTYWHGLNRSFEELQASSNPRDKIILRKKKTDAEQDAWFENHALSLVRITENQVKSGDFNL